MALAKRQNPSLARAGRAVTLALAMVAVLALHVVPARADVVGIGDITPSKPDPDFPSEQIPDLPQFGGPVTGGVVTVGGTGSPPVGGTSAGQMTIDIPSDTDPLVSDRGIIGGTAQGFGSVRVLQLNSQWTVTEDLIVGEGGQGYLELVGGARVLTGNSGLTPVPPYDLQVGALDGSQGFILIDGRSSLLLHHDLGLGVEGFGSVEVLNEARLETANTAVLGALNGEGYALVQGGGSRWNIGTAGSGFLGDLTIGSGGRGIVDVYGGGLVYAQGNTVLGLLPDSFGEIVVADRNSQFRTLGQMDIGILGTGRVEIGARGLVRTGTTTFLGGSGLIEMAGGTLQSPVVDNNGVIRGDGRIQTDLVVNDGDIRTAAGIANLRERLWITGALDNNNYIDSLGGEMEVEGFVTNNGRIYGRDAVFRFRGGFDGGELFLEKSWVEAPLASPALLTVAPGLSTITGDLDLGGGALAVTIGDNFSQLLVGGDADLAGAALNVTLGPGYTPEGGDSFKLISSPYGLISAGFALPIQIPATPGIFWMLDYDPDAVYLNAFAGVAPDDDDADFDGDGDVDGADFLTWQRNLTTPSPTLAQGNANGDGAVDGADLLIWKDQFGTSVAAGSPVPEPGAIALALAAVLAAPLWRKRRP